MEEKKNKETKELTEEELDKASGGHGQTGYTCFVCKRIFFGRGISINGKTYCPSHVPEKTFL